MTKPTAWLLGVALAMIAGPTWAAPCAGFTDVEDTSPFCPNVSWLRNRSITLGCAATLYCPNDPVTRLQMAAFMNRLGDALFPLTCAAGQVMKWNGLTWGCANDNIGGGGGGGTVSSVAAGTGLQASPNPITGAGAINVAPSYQLPQSCANGQVAKSNGAGGWTCAADNDTNSGGTVTSLTAGSGIALAPNPIVGAGTIAADTSYLQRRVSQSCLAGSSIRAIAADGSVTCEVDSGTNAFVQGGNAFGGTAALGTSDNNALDLRANNARVMRYEPNAVSPNMIGGSPANTVTAGVRGATIAGGGVPAGDTDPLFASEAPNRVTDACGTVGGGYGNRAGDDAGTTVDSAFATVGGGRSNTASHASSTVGGGTDNVASGFASTVGGGVANTASGNHSRVGGGNDNTASGHESTVDGGLFNTATGWLSTVGGGNGNDATGRSSTIGGGQSNTASGQFSTVAGGSNNVAGGDYSVAMGLRAKALGDGSFSFADSNHFDFSANSVNAFRVRATGGVRFVVDIDAAGATTWSCLLNTGAGWNCASDRSLKQDLVALDGGEVLAKLAAMPVYAWSPKGRNAHLRHYGPMAQDFHAAFGLGDDDTMIGMQDADGVALAAIQGLNAKLEAKIARKDAEIAAERAARGAQAREIAKLKRVLAKLLTTR